MPAMPANAHRSQIAHLLGMSPAGWAGWCTTATPDDLAAASRYLAMLSTQAAQLAAYLDVQHSYCFEPEDRCDAHAAAVHVANEAGAAVGGALGLLHVPDLLPGLPSAGAGAAPALAAIN